MAGHHSPSAQSPQSAVQTTRAIPDTDNHRDKRARGITAHLRNQRNPRFRQHPQSPIQTTIGTIRRGESQPICAISGSDNTRNPRSRQPSGQNGAGHHSPSAKICVIRGSDNTRNPRSRQPSGQSGGASQPICENLRNLRFRQHAQSPVQTTIGTKRRGASQPICAISVIRGSNNTRNPRYRQPSGQIGGASQPILQSPQSAVQTTRAIPDPDNDRDKRARGITAHLRKSA